MKLAHHLRPASPRSIRSAVTYLALAVGLLASGCTVEVDGEEVANVPEPDLPTVEIPMDTAEMEALATTLTEALVQEQSAKVSYDNVIAKFGPVAPFSEITKDEKTNISAVRAVARHHGITFDNEPVPGSPTGPTRGDSCFVAVEIEKTGIDLYDTLLPQVQAYPDVTKVLTKLRATAKNDHLPAFQSCSSV